MKIKKLELHCGICDIIEYCGSEYCLCSDGRFGDMEETEYIKIAETATGIKELDACRGCDRPDCGVYKYGDDDFADEDCEHSDEARDYYCEQIADCVSARLCAEKEGGNGNDGHRNS